MDITAQSTSAVEKMNFLQKWLPERGRRIVAIVSLYGYLCKLYKRRPSKLDKLQRDLNLARSKRAVFFPVFLGKPIWGKVDVDHTTLQSLTVNDLMCMMRHCDFTWLRYDGTRSERVLQSDMSVVLDALRQSPATDIVVH